MDDVAKVLLGALLSLVAGFFSEEIKKRRRLWAAARVLLYELQRIFRSVDPRDPREILSSKSLQVAIDEYRVALFAVDSAKFNDHWPIYRDLMELLDSDMDDDQKVTNLSLHVRRLLGALLGSEQLGAAEQFGVPETGSPVTFGD